MKGISRGLCGLRNEWFGREKVGLRYGKAECRVKKYSEDKKTVKECNRGLNRSDSRGVDQGS